MYNETYDNYIRSILGYPPLNPFENNMQDYRNQNFDMSVDMDLENCYPEIYKIVYPMIEAKCDNVRMTVTKDDIENMTNEIYYALEEREEVRSTERDKIRNLEKKSDIKQNEISNEKRETRQINRNLRDLIQILLIRELLRRRRPGGRPPMPPRPPMRPPMRPPFRPGGTQFNRDLEMSNYDMFEY